MSSTPMAAVDVPDKGPTILAVCWVLVLIPGLIVGLRVWCKIMFSRGFGWDDAVICVAWILLLIYTALVTQAVKMGVIGKHVDAIVDPEAIPPALEMLYISFIILIIGCALSKTSFALTLLRIVLHTWMKVLLWFIIISMNAIMWLCAVCYLLQCDPAAALWDSKLMATAKCWPPAVFQTIALTAGAYSGCMDLILALLPWGIIFRLQMKTREKFGIVIAMSMGVFAAVTAFIKTSQLVNVSKVSDFTWFCSSIILWASAETGLTIFAASIPSLRFLFMRLRSSYERTSTSSPELYDVLSRARKRHRKNNKNHSNWNPASPPDVYWCNQDDAFVGVGRRNESRNSILGIRQTQEVTVTFERIVRVDASTAEKRDVGLELVKESRRSRSLG